MPQPPDVIATKATNSLMPAARTPRAAQYVRMSTDHQSYSPANQADANVLAGPLNSGHGGGDQNLLELQLPKIKSASDVPVAMAAVAAAVCSGSITPDEASRLVHLLERYSNAIIASEFAVRLQNLEAQVQMMIPLKR